VDKVESKENNMKTFCIFIVVLFIISCINCSSPKKIDNSDTSQKNQDKIYRVIVEDKAVKKISSKGVDLNFYYVQSREEKINLSNCSPEELKKLQKRAFIGALKEFREKLPIDISQALTENIEKGEIGINSIIEKKTPLHYFVSVYSQNGSFDYKSNTYSYKIRLITPKNALYIFPEEFRCILEEYLKKEISITYEDIMDGKKIDVGKIITNLNLKKYKSLTDRLKTLTHEYEEIIKNLDNETGKFFNKLTGQRLAISNFPPGDFSMSIIMGLVINKFKNEFENILSLHPNLKVNVTCRGYTDSVSVKKNGISYQGEGKWSSQGDTISFVTKSYKPLKPTIYDNYQLSYARAYSGIEYLRNIISEEFISNGLINFQYRGDGKAKAAKENNSYHRRIEFYIKIIK
jgi:hypothetical protein